MKFTQLLIVPKTPPATPDALPKISRRRLKKLVTDAAASAEAIHLHYVSDGAAGINRIREGKDFVYELAGKPVHDESTLARIRALVLPPAWEAVWICADAAGHLHDLARPGLPEEKVLAALVSIMQHTGIRIGSNEYEKLYGSFGLSTLKDKHVRISGAQVKFSFRGKKGVAQHLSLRSRKLASIVKKCRDIPGKELFQYIDSEGIARTVDSGRVNAYIKDISGGHFTAKDFRTWTGSLHALQAFRELGCSTISSATEAKRNINTALDAVSKHLGNTRTVCRKYYVHPALLDLYECRELERYLKVLDEQPDTKGDGLTQEEEVLMKILEKA